MHIISSFRDYYDIGLREGFDKSLQYRRFEEDGTVVTLRRTHRFNERTKQIQVPKGWITIKVKLEPIIFCGTYYERAISHVTYPNPLWGHITDAPVNSSDVYVGTDRETLTTRIYNEFGVVEPDPHLNFLWEHEVSREKEFSEFVKNFDWIPVHIANKAPVLTFREADSDDGGVKKVHRDGDMQIVTNPRLARLGFWQVRDAYSTYQDISMFLGGVMGTEGKDMVQLTDSEVHQKHGFDKWSFRKMPEGTK